MELSQYSRKMRAATSAGALDDAERSLLLWESKMQNDKSSQQYGLSEDDFVKIKRCLKELSETERAGYLWTILTPEILEDFRKFAHGASSSALTSTFSVLNNLYLNLYRLFRNAGIDPETKWNEVDQFVKYCHQIMRNIVRTSARSRVNIVSASSSEPSNEDGSDPLQSVPANTPDPYDVVADQEFFEYVSKTISDCLSEREKIILIARTEENLTFSQIALLPELQEYDLKEDQVRYAYNKAFSKIRTKIEAAL